MDYQQIVVYTVIAIPTSSKSRWRKKKGGNSSSSGVRLATLRESPEKEDSEEEKKTENKSGIKSLWLELLTVGLVRAVVFVWKRYLIYL